MPTFYECVFSGAVIAYCTYTDLKSRTISPWICLTLLILAIVEPGKDYVHALCSFLIGFIPLFITARFGNGGDGDALLAGAICFTLGLEYAAGFMMISLFAYILALTVVVLETHNKKKQLPFVPFMALGWITELIYVFV